MSTPPNSIRSASDLAELSVVARKMAITHDLTSSAESARFKRAEEYIHGLCHVLVDGTRHAARLRQIVDTSELTKENLPSKIAGLMTSEIAAALKGTIESRIAFHHHKLRLREWGILVLIGVGVFIAGAIFSREDQPPSQTERAVAACAADPLMSGGTRYCRLRDVMPFTPPLASEDNQR